MYESLKISSEKNDEQSSADRLITIDVSLMNEKKTDDLILSMNKLILAY